MSTAKPTTTLVPAAKSQPSAAPFIVVVLLSLLFAGAIWTAGTSKPMVDPTIAAMQGGL